MFIFNTDFLLYPVDPLASCSIFRTRGIYRRSPMVATTVAAIIATAAVAFVMKRGGGDTGTPPHPIAAENHLLPSEQQVVACPQLTYRPIAISVHPANILCG
jgi:hypothetical protein